MYAIVFISALGLAALGLLVTWFRSRNPLFAREGSAKFSRWRAHAYEALPTDIGNGSGIHHAKGSASKPETFRGWRWGMGVLLNAASPLSLIDPHGKWCLLLESRLYRLLGMAQSFPR